MNIRSNSPDKIYYQMSFGTKVIEKYFSFQCLFHINNCETSHSSPRNSHCATFSFLGRTLLLLEEIQLLEKSETQIQISNPSSYGS